ncbi:subtype B tannase [Streptomyces sp. NPDC005962]|uniref:subtype B tannase n=1 Tax=Streptomyces sp. NPDC005962 TaxID=3154466 RepID=UPI0033E0C995
MGLAAATAVSTAGISTAATARSRKAPDALVFDEDAYTVLTTTIATDDGDKGVTYHFYKAVTYVTNPVDAKYQCLNVSVPVEIDGKAVDATRAPILFANSVGGYMPSSVADATGVGGSPMTPPGGGGGGGGGGQAAMVSNAKLAVAAGYVVVEPGARGRSLVDANGTYYGTAPTAIVDLKAAVRYVRFNKGRIPGNTDRIVSSGTSAGGALSALLGASGDSPLYEADLTELGAAPASDAIFAGGAWCPIADLEHSDMAYEWNWGGNALSSGDTVDRAVSRELRSAFAEYQASLKLRGKNGPLTSRTYDDYLVKTYLEPAATTYLNALSASGRSGYLADNPWLTWFGDRATFSWADFLTHVGARKKNTPAFDPFDLSAGENNLFGTGTTQARHFTLYSLRHATGNASARLDADLPRKLDQMNPMYFIERRNPARAKHWWIRVGTKDTDTSLTVVGNLAAGLENLGDDVDALMYWDAGHGANQDAADFMTWIGRVTGYST